MSHIIRNEQGIMVAEVSGRLVDTILRSANGNWRPYKTDDYDGVCFEISEDAKYTLGNGSDSIVIFLWNGYKVIPNYK